MSTIRRVYFYVVSLITLGILAAGIRTLLSFFLAGLLRTILFRHPSGTDFVQQQLSLGLAIVVIGGPLWFFFWRHIQRQVMSNPAEIGAAIRKLYLNLIQAVAVPVALFMASDILKWLMAGRFTLPKHLRQPGDFHRDNSSLVLSLENFGEERTTFPGSQDS